MQTAITALAYHLPDKVLSNAHLAAEFPEYTVDKIGHMTGIEERHVVEHEECSSDLAVAAAQKLLPAVCRPEDIDFLLLCTQTPDHFLPTTACLVQDRLGLSTAAGAMDLTIGCSGYVYGLSVAKGLLETGQARRVLLITTEVITKLIHPEDRSVRSLFGDGAAATLLELVPDDADAPPWLGPFVFGTDGRGAGNLIVPAGGMRRPRSAATGQAEADGQGNRRSADNLYMNGTEIFTFTLKTVPQAVRTLLERAGRSLEEIDLFVLHQANEYMLDHLRRKIGIPKDKFVVCLKHCGNTSSCSIPIALAEAAGAGRLVPGALVMLVGFGVGYSWGANLLRWAPSCITVAAAK